ncbi:MAG: hypothetical protein ACK4HW_08395 [Roseinatronobacter sp.]
MREASRITLALVKLAEALAAHEGSSLDALSGRALGKGHFFAGLKRGADCCTATAERVLGWFHSVWPIDLPWPANVARPAHSDVMAGAFKPAGSPKTAPVLPEVDDAFLARLSHLPIWSNGRRPSWWDDIEVRAFLTRSHRQMSTQRAAALGARHFGARCPKKSAIHTYWQRLDRLHQWRVE